MCRPPLCAAVGSQEPLELVNLLKLPCKMYRHGLGVGELEKNASALAYAMLSGQHDVVKAVSTQAALLLLAAHSALLCQMCLCRAATEHMCLHAGITIMLRLDSVVKAV